MDYVLVIILSDTTGMDGGRLEVVMKPGEEALKLLQVRKGEFQKDELLIAEYPGILIYILQIDFKKDLVMLF